MTTAAQRLNQDAEICREALPCPFCGSHATIEFWHGGKPSKRLVACSAHQDECDVGPMVTGETKAEAIARWNRRAPVLE